MSEVFKPIETQEQFNEAIKDRLARERESVKKEFEGYLSPDDVKKKEESLSAQIAELNKTIETGKNEAAEAAKKVSELEAKNKEYETASVKSRIAHESGLPYEAISFLQGDDEESIQKSANVLKGLVNKPGGGLPGFDSESGNSGKSSDSAYKELLNNVRGEKE